MTDGTIHSIAPFMLQGSTSTPHSPTIVGLDLMLRLWMDSSRVQRMLPNLQERAVTFKEMEIYRMVGGTFGFDMVVHYRKTKMPCKLQVHFIANFNVSSPFVSNFKISMLFLMFLTFYFLLFVLDAWWTSYGRRVPHYKSFPFGC